MGPAVLWMSAGCLVLWAGLGWRLPAQTFRDPNPAPTEQSTLPWADHPTPYRRMSGQVQLARLSPVEFVRARRVAPGLRLVAAERAGTGQGATYLVSRSQENVAGPQHLRGRRLALSVHTTDRLSALAFLMEQGLTPGRDVELMLRTDPFEALETQQAHVAAVGDRELSRLHPDRRRGLRIVAVAGRLPEALWVATEDVAEPTIQAWRRQLRAVEPGRGSRSNRRWMELEVAEESMARLEARWQRYATQLMPWLGTSLSAASQPTEAGS